MGYFPEQLTTLEYYKRLLPMYLRQSYGYPDHFRIMQTVLKNIVDVGNDILGGFDIFGDNYLDYIDSLGSDTDNDTLDKLGKIWGVPRVLSVISGTSQSVSDQGYMNIVLPGAQQTTVNLGWQPSTFTFDYDTTTESFIGLELPTVADSNPIPIEMKTNVVPSSWKVYVQVTDGGSKFIVPLTYSSNKFSITYGVYKVEINVLSNSGGIYYMNFMATKNNMPLTYTHSVIVYQTGTTTHTTTSVVGSWTGTDPTNSYINITGTGFNYKLAGGEWQNNSVNKSSGAVNMTQTVNLGYQPDVVVFEYDEDVEGDPEEDIPAHVEHYRVTCFDYVDEIEDDDPDNYITITATGFTIHLVSTFWGDGYGYNLRYSAGKVTGSSGTMLNPHYSCSATISGGLPTTVTLDNKLYLMLLKAVIGRAFYDGTREQALMIYERQGLAIAYEQSDLTKQKVDVYLRVSSADLAEEPNLPILFEAGLLTIQSMGIEYEYHTVTYG